MPPDDLNIAETVSSIAADLFPKEEPPAPASPEPPAGLVPPEKGEEPPASPAPPPTLKSLPKSWKKEMEAIWAKADPLLHDYVYEREANVDRGFQMYADGHKKWDALTTPYKQILSEYPNVDPVPLLQNLLNSHITLVRGTPEQKQALLQRLFKDYGIEGTLPASPTPPPEDPRVRSLEAGLEEIKKSLQARMAAEEEAGVAEQLKVVEAFAKENPFFDEVSSDIHRFIATGAAPDLKSAYELACYANPAVRAKVLAKQQESAPSPPSPPRPTNVDGSGAATPRPPKKGDINDTIDSIIAKHYPTH